jgi:succinate-semialdehyde dehydrogenase / glutarate-semialdehyde dehydrogenase
MSFRSINPYDGSTLQRVEPCSDAQLEQALRRAADASPAWRERSWDERSRLLKAAAAVLRGRSEQLARMMSLEMGKLIKEARGEIEKCVWVCEHYAEQGARYLADEIIATDASKSLIAYQPLGTVLAIMPWNFPFWQVFRFAAPALAAGNTALLKHASNVPQCALAIEAVFVEAGFPAGVFQTLLIGAERVVAVIADPRVHAVTLTGSEAAGRQVAALAGTHLKKSVMELGGSDPFIVLDDAELDLAVSHAVTSRYLNAGQSCIAAKRFVVLESIADEFLARFKTAVGALCPGDPLDERTSLAPLARHDLRDELHKQVLDSLAQGATAIAGCRPGSGPGAFYEASILGNVLPGTRAYHEELFGPVAVVLRARDDADALRIANDTRFGLGGSVWSADTARAERLARQLICGCAFVNGMVKSDPRLPFGGVRDSGYGRELSQLGIREFVNAKTLWVR